MEVKLQTKLTLFAPFKKRHTRTLVLHRTSMSSDSVDDLLAAMESRGWTTRSSPSSPSPAMVRSCRSCGCQKFRKEFSRHQCRKPSPCCLNCTSGERIVIAVEKKRRLGTATPPCPDHAGSAPNTLTGAEVALYAGCFCAGASAVSK